MTGLGNTEAESYIRIYKNDVQSHDQPLSKQKQIKFKTFRNSCTSKNLNKLHKYRLDQIRGKCRRNKIWIHRRGTSRRNYFFMGYHNNP